MNEWDTLDPLPVGVDPNAVPVASDPSMLSSDYYRQKIQEFQNTLYSMDGIYTDLMTAGTVLPGDSDSYNEWLSLITEFEGKRGQFRIVAEAMNAATSGLSYIGVDLPTLTIPTGLGAVQLVPLAVVAGVLGAAYVLVQWARTFSPIVSDALKRWQQSSEIQSLPEADRAAALSQLSAIDADVEKKRAEIDASSITAIANAAKYALVAVALYFGYKMWKESR